VVLPAVYAFGTLNKAGSYPMCCRNDTGDILDWKDQTCTPRPAMRLCLGHRVYLQNPFGKRGLKQSTYAARGWLREGVRERLLRQWFFRLDVQLIDKASRLWRGISILLDQLYCRLFFPTGLRLLINYRTLITVQGLPSQSFV